MTIMETEVVHLSSASLDGDYRLVESREDGRIVLDPIDTTIDEMRERHGLREISDERFEKLFGDLPTGAF